MQRQMGERRRVRELAIKAAARYLPSEEHQALVRDIAAGMVEVSLLDDGLILTRAFQHASCTKFEARGPPDAWSGSRARPVLQKTGWPMMVRFRALTRTGYCARLARCDDWRQPYPRSGAALELQARTI